METRVCRTCKTEKPFGDFNKRQQAGLQEVCRLCASKYNRNRYAQMKLEPISPTEQKECSSCKVTKTASEFNRHTGNKDGLFPYCRDCQSRKNREWQAENKEYALQKRTSIRREILAHYSDGDPRCECCGERTVEFLALDHINGGGAKHRKSVKNMTSWIIKNDFPPIFRVLCHNCNMAKGLYGRCPHQRNQTTF